MEKEEYKKLIDNISKHREELERKKIENENSDEGNIYYNDDEKIVAIFMHNKFYLFDRKHYEIFYKWLWDEDNLLSVDDDGYLIVVNKKTNYTIRIHHYFKKEEVEDLANKLGCPIIDIHVHHMDKQKENNLFDNLEVLHKDEHAQRHGFNTWEKLLKFREDKMKEKLSKSF